MKVCIAEKPSVAREIAEVLGARTKREGYIEGNGYQVSWTYGHLCTLKEPHDYTPEWKSWRLQSLPMIPPRFGIKLIPSDSYEKQFRILEGLIRNAEAVINCGDAGQEGELIQRWVMQKAGCRCPVYRLWISSLTEDAIREGFKNLKDESDYQRLYEAGLSRAIGDWLLGMNATRLYTLRYGQNRQVLSIGRVQTPTLALIVKRQKEIEAFKPEPYWELKTIYRETMFAATQGKFARKEEGQALLEAVTGRPFVITGVAKKKGKEAPPRLFDLTSLQVECNRKFAFSAEDTFMLKGLTDYASLTASLLSGPIRKSKKVFDNTKVTDHHAIVPTGVPPRNLTDHERKVYDLVARRFIAAFYPDCEISTTTVLGEVEKTGFKATGKQILKPGWRVIFGKETQETAEEEQPTAEENGVLPDFVKGERGPHQPDFAEKWTTPPKPYTEATLLRAMETAGKFVEDEELRDALKENGIGRPSTRAAIIETLFKRNYIRKERKNLSATSTGVELIGIIRDELLKSAELTGQWEKKLRQIEQGVYQAEAFLDELKQMVGQMVRNVRTDRTTTTITIEEMASGSKEGKNTKASAKEKPVKVKRKKQDTVTQDTASAHGSPTCPICGKGTLLRGKTAYGCSEYKSGCTFRLSYEQHGKDLSNEELLTLVRKQSFPRNP